MAIVDIMRYARALQYRAMMDVCLNFAAIMNVRARPEAAASPNR